MAPSATSRPQRLAGSPAGFTLLAVIIAIAVMNIFLGVAVTRWTFVNQRDREIELIWRGEQYSRALQCFIEKRGAPPMELEELLEEHCIRRLYADPMSASGEWRFLYASDLGEEFAELVAGIAAGGSDSVDFEPQAGGDLMAEGDPGAGVDTGAGGGLGRSRSGQGRSSLLDRMRNRRSKTGSQSGHEADGSLSGFGSRSGRGGSGSRFGSNRGQGSGGSLSELGSMAGQDAGSAGLASGSNLGGSGNPSEGDPEMAPEGAEAGRQSLRERAKGRFESRLAERDLTGRGGSKQGVIAGILGVATSGSGDSIRTYKDTNRYEEWYFTLGSANQPVAGAEASGPQLPGQGTPLPTDSGTTGIRGSTEERQSRFRRPNLRRGG